MTIKLIVAVKGSAKSGNYGHAGRAGKLGGSAGNALRKRLNQLQRKLDLPVSDRD